MAFHVTALLLAAGRSKRMGRLKQLLPVPHEPAIRLCLERIQAAGVEDITVVLGHERERIARAIRRFPVRIAVNPEIGSEMAESVRVGLKTLGPRISGVIVCLCDHPLVSSTTYRLLATTHLRNPSQIVIPTHNGKNGHPTLFPREVIHRVFDGLHLKAIVQAHPRRVIRVPVEDNGIRLDMDTPEDYRKACELGALIDHPKLKDLSESCSSA